MSKLYKYDSRKRRMVFNADLLGIGDAEAEIERLEGLEEGTIQIPDEAPAKLEVCGACSGSGVTTRHVERDGGGFTASEWAEECYEDPDFADNYLGGMYDRPCPECNGLRVVPEMDEDHTDPRLLKLVNEYYEGERQSRMDDYYERRMGC